MQSASDSLYHPQLAEKTAISSLSERIATFLGFLLRKDNPLSSLLPSNLTSDPSSSPDSPSLSLVLGSAVGGAVVLSVLLLLWRWTSPKKKNDYANDPVVVKKASLPPPETGNEREADDGKKRITIFFGTQTGTAESYARALSVEGSARYPNVIFTPVDLEGYGMDDEEYERKLKREKLVIFTLATYGDGEPTDNAARFYKCFTNVDGRDSWLSGLQYAVFGLGNRQYEHFNRVGITVDEALEKQGAERLVPCGLGDDDKCLEDDFAAWRELLWPVLDTLLRNPDDEESLTVTVYSAAIPEYRIVYHDKEAKVSEAEMGIRGGMNACSNYDATHPCRVKVSARRELHTPASDRSCTHLEFDISDTSLMYETGDHVGVYAENSEESVEEAAALLGIPLESTFSLYSEAEDESPFPGPCTLRYALANYADLLSTPRKTALIALAAHASDPTEADRLKYLASPAGKEEFSKWASESQRSLLEVMSEFPSAKPPLGVFFAAVAPRLAPRFYSISSSSRASPTKIHVSCALVCDHTPTGRIHRGVCSTWMKNAIPSLGKEEDKCSWAPIFVRQSNFRLPSDPLIPIIMVGPGTGFAPFRGFLQERSVLKKSGCELGEAMLFFGCRSHTQDFIYESEMKEFLEEGIISHLSVSFSRDGPIKEYVQHKMLQEAEQLWQLLSCGGGYLYVCGDAKSMAKDVHKTLHTIIQQQGHLELREAEEMVKDLQLKGRYLRDVW